MTEVISLDGSFVSADKARLPALSRAVLYGEGLFETVRTYGGRPFALARHLARLEASALTLGIPLPAELAGVQRVITRLLLRNKLSDAVVRISVLAGEPSGIGLSAPASGSHLLIITRDVPPTLDEERERGVSAVTLDAGSLPLSAHKTTSYLRSVAAARGHPGAREVLFVDEGGRILEGATSNVLALFGTRIVTPPADGRILPGVTRQILLDIAGKAGLKVQQRPLAARKALDADGLLITNSVIELLPVIELDGRAIGGSRPHPITRLLHGLYRDRVSAELGPV
jgi:branched-subunit amino acid aminotransferase/4-amino-4-deoxychorismate lyase